MLSESVAKFAGVDLQDLLSHGDYGGRDGHSRNHRLNLRKTRAHVSLTSTPNSRYILSSHTFARRSLTITSEAPKDDNIQSYTRFPHHLSRGVCTWKALTESEQRSEGSHSLAGYRPLQHPKKTKFPRTLVVSARLFLPFSWVRGRRKRARSPFNTQ